MVRLTLTMVKRRKAVSGHMRDRLRPTGSRASYEMSTTTHSPIQYSSVLISTKYFSLREKDFESSQGKAGLADVLKLGHVKDNVAEVLATK